MQFFLLLVANLFMGAIFYLVISLKLEKSATEFREKRLRREMDDMIKEFNATAERNISLLENRIAVLRRLMAMNGDLKSLDVTVGADEFADGAADGASLTHSPSEPTVPADRDPSSKGRQPGPLKKGLRILAEKLYTSLNAPHDTQGGAEEVWTGAAPAAPGPAGFDDDGGNHLIQRELAAVPEAPTRVLLNDDEIASIVSQADSRYTLITLLSERGCDADDISRYSGIPLGEVKLVLNLNNSRQ